VTDKDDNGLSTKREMVRLLAKDATGEQLDAAIDACVDSALNDAERRSVLIETIYRSWCVRLGKRAQPLPTWEDVRQMFLDIHAAVGVPQTPLKLASLGVAAPTARLLVPMAGLSVGVPQPPPKSASSDEKSECQDMAAPVARLSVGVPAHEARDDSVVLERLHRAFEEPPPKSASSDEKSGRVRLSLNWARARPIVPKT
jgi:hypothetical protein